MVCYYTNCNLNCKTIGHHHFTYANMNTRKKDSQTCKRKEDGSFICPQKKSSKVNWIVAEELGIEIKN